MIPEELRRSCVSVSRKSICAVGTAEQREILPGRRRRRQAFSGKGLSYREAEYGHRLPLGRAPIHPGLRSAKKRGRQKSAKNADDFRNIFPDIPGKTRYASRRPERYNVIVCGICSQLFSAVLPAAGPENGRSAMRAWRVR